MAEGQPHTANVIKFADASYVVYQDCSLLVCALIILPMSLSSIQSSLRWNGRNLVPASLSTIHSTVSVTMVVWNKPAVFIHVFSGYLTFVYEGMRRLWPNFESELAKAGGQ